MTTLEALLTTATTLERIEDLLDQSNERDLKAAFKLVRLEVADMIEQETTTPGRYDGLAD